MRLEIQVKKKKKKKRLLQVLQVSYNTATNSCNKS